MKTQENIAGFLGRNAKITQRKTFFQKEGDFASFNAALEWAAELGYSSGSLCLDMPVVLCKGKYNENLPQKWRKMSNDDAHFIQGLIISEDFRHGAVTVLIF